MGFSDFCISRYPFRYTYRILFLVANLWKYRPPTFRGNPSIITPPLWLRQFIKFHANCLSIQYGRVRMTQILPQFCGYFYRSYYEFTLAYYGLIIWSDEASAMTSRSSLSILLQGEQSIALDGFPPSGLPQLRGTLTQRNVTCPQNYDSTASIEAHTF